MALCGGRWWSVALGARGQRQVWPVASFTHDAPLQQSLLPGWQNCPRAWHRQVCEVPSHSMAPQQSDESTQGSLFCRQTQCPPWQRLWPQHSVWEEHGTTGAVGVSAGRRQQVRVPDGWRLQV